LVETLPIVALTAAAFEEDRERCQRVRTNDFVTKPVSAERLRAVLVRWRQRGVVVPERIPSGLSLSNTGIPVASVPSSPEPRVLL
jgi:DNA-binding response OmpR family regulator